MIVEEDMLRTALLRACGDAGIEAGACVVWVVDAACPPGATPIAYLQPAGRVRPDTVQVFRAVGAGRAAAFAGAAHRLAVWRELPGLPAAALGPMLRHELAHAVRWEESGAAFYAADERLRGTVGASSYALLPTEREANAAAAAFARRTLGADGLAELAAAPELASLLDTEPPADVVAETVALLGEPVRIEPARLARGPAGPIVQLVTPAADSAGMP